MWTVILLFFTAANACRIDSSIHGVYKKQSNNYIPLEGIIGRQNVIYEEISITATSISNFGDCYSKHGPSYVMGLKRMGRPICFRCLTPLLLSANVLQLAHQYEENCYETEKEAKMTCFDSSLVTISDGALLFKSSEEQAASCSPMDGRFEVSYRMNDAALSCETGDGTVADNCQSSSRIQIQFKNCSFPDFDMTLRCIGQWKDKTNQHYFVVQNEENEEYRCGLVIEEPNVRKLYFANDSSCSSLTMKTAFDSYYFHSGAISKPFAPCSFPVWMQGEFDSMKVSSHELQYLQHHIGAVPLVSHCVQTFEDRVMVFSETKCGEPLGYHCLLFNARSQNLIEFKTSIPTDKSNISICTNSTQWDNVPWFSSVVLNTSPYPCGIFGTYSTPKTPREDYCYDVVFDCDLPSKMSISAYHCDSGVVFDARTYTCLASWKHDDRLLIYTNREKDANECFVTHFKDGKFLMAATGDQCERNIDFSKNEELIMVLEEKQSCRRHTFKSRKQTIPPKILAAPNYVLNTTTPSEDVTTTTSSETSELSVLSDEFWFSSSSTNSTSLLLITIMIIISVLL